MTMGETPPLALSGVVLDSPDARELAGFYRRLLGWAVEEDEPDWVRLRSPAGGAGLSFQTESRYVRPVWPAGPGVPNWASGSAIVTVLLASSVSMAAVPTGLPLASTHAGAAKPCASTRSLQAPADAIV